jgi:hypothetical protein
MHSVMDKQPNFASLSVMFSKLQKVIAKGYFKTMISQDKSYEILPPFQNIRCFRFVKQMYLDTF